MAKPEVLYSVGFRAERRVTFEAKESALFEMPKRGGTRGIATLGDHDSTPSAAVGLLMFYFPIAQGSVTYVAPHCDWTRSLSVRIGWRLRSIISAVRHGSEEDARHGCG